MVTLTATSTSYKEYLPEMDPSIISWKMSVCQYFVVSWRGHQGRQNGRKEYTGGKYDNVSMR